MKLWFFYEGEKVAKILISAGPIPARLDSVKYLTNRFKGGLAVKTAHKLTDLGHDVTIIKWKFSGIDCHGVNGSIDVEDILDYKDKVLNFDADVYVLAAAVANLMPSNPWEGKFPSHDYSVGEEFDIKFQIAPRIIDLVKKAHPRAGLVGYKLFDGTDEELIKAGTETLENSKANIVFANHPAWAKKRKIMLTQDGAEIPVTFNQHISVINKLAHVKWYKTEIDSGDPFSIISMKLKAFRSELDNFTYPTTRKGNRVYGSFALRDRKQHSFITTTRGKQGTGLTYISKVDHKRRIVTATHKATLNAPLFDMLFKKHPEINILIHGHKQIKTQMIDYQYRMPGTDSEVNIAKKGTAFWNDWNVFNIKHHGYIAGFVTIEECKRWMEKNEKES